MVIKEEKSSQQVEAGSCRHSTANESDRSPCFSDADDEHWHSPYESNSVNEYRLSIESSHEISGVQEPCRNSCISDCSAEVDLECGTPGIKVNVEKTEKDCRICHLNLESHAQESGIPIVLGCSCKGDLAAAHKQCAETWFKIKGNKTCEICGATAKNVVGSGETEFIESWNESGNNSAPPAPQTETRSFWQGHRFLNFLLACMIFGMAEKEMEYRVELFNKLTHTCFNKCVEKRYKESELNMGENSCIDRCVSKYWQVTNLVGQLLGSGQQQI